MDKILPLMVGGIVGTLSRYFLSMWVVQTFGCPAPVGTITVNLVGCFILGFLAGLAEVGLILSTPMRLLLMVGFLGAFTTFSSYEYESFLLLKSKMLWQALFNLLGSVVFGLVSLWLGFLLAQFLFRTLKGT